MISMSVITSALELGFIYALVAFALFLSFRVLNIADMTTDGSFTLGCAVSATLAVAGHPYLALIAAMAAGACAGMITSALQTKLGVPVTIENANIDLTTNTTSTSASPIYAEDASITIKNSTVKVTTTKGTVDAVQTARRKGRQCWTSSTQYEDRFFL